MALKNHAFCSAHNFLSIAVFILYFHPIVSRPSLHSPPLSVMEFCVILCIVPPLFSLQACIHPVCSGLLISSGFSLIFQLGCIPSKTHFFRSVNHLLSTLCANGDWPSVVILNTLLGVVVLVLCHRFLISPCSIYSSYLALGRLTVCTLSKTIFFLNVTRTSSGCVRVAIKHDCVFNLISITIEGVTKLH